MRYSGVVQSGLSPQTSSPEKCLSPEKTENQDSENQLKKILTQDSEIPEP
jgi:hypothetical protein